MPKLYTYFTHAEFGNIDHHFEQVYIIDVLRATTTMITALNHGAREIFPVESVEEALALKKILQIKDERRILLAGERKGIMIDGFDRGNSPLEFIESNVAEASLIMTTSNGTYAIKKSIGVERSRILANANISRSAKTIDIEKDTAIICAGSHREFSIEDVLCAGSFIGLTGQYENWQYNDQSIFARTYMENTFNEFLPGPEKLFSLVSKGIHARRLFDLKAEKDVRYCCNYDIFDSSAIYNGESIKLEENRE